MTAESPVQLILRAADHLTAHTTPEHRVVDQATARLMRSVAAHWQPTTPPWTDQAAAIDLARLILGEPRPEQP